MNSDFAPFKRNKGKGVPSPTSPRQIEVLFQEEERAYSQTISDMQSLMGEFNDLKTRFRVANNVQLTRVRKRLVRNGKTTDFSRGITRTYLRWVYVRPDDGRLVANSPLSDYPNLMSTILSKMPSDGRKYLGHLEFTRLALIHQVRAHIEVFNWLTDLQEFQAAIRAQ